MAGALSVLGAAALALLARSQVFPRPLWLWALFAVFFVILEWRAVEINHHLAISPSIMVAMTAAVAFGPSSATLGVATMAALAAVTPGDFRRRSWFEPLANFGVLVITATVAVTILELILPTTIEPGSVWRVAVGSAVAAVIYGIVNLNLVAFTARRVYGRHLQPWAHMAANYVPFLGMGFLGGLLGAAYVLVGIVILPVIAAVFFVGHLTFASYGDLREAEEATLRGFVKALEAKDPYTRGHTERVAYFAQLIGEELEYDGDGLERLRWSALIHDVGKLAVPRQLIRKPGRLDPDEYRAMQNHVHAVEHLLAEVEFLAPMVEIAAEHHSHFDGGGYGGSADTGDRPQPEACILAVADAFDAMTSTRSYRLALSQDYAFEELRRNAGSQFDPEAVEALARALERIGEVYGSVHLTDDVEARRLAEQEVDPSRTHG